MSKDFKFHYTSAWTLEQIFDKLYVRIHASSDVGLGVCWVAVVIRPSFWRHMVTTNDPGRSGRVHRTISLPETPNGPALMTA